MIASPPLHRADGYERLRSHALGGPAPDVPLLRTLDVLLQNGLAVWMIFGLPEANIPLTLRSGHSSLVPQRELIFILAEMIEPFLLT